MIPIVKSRAEPNNIHTLWIDESNNTIKIFGPNGWEAITGQEQDISALKQAISNIDKSLNSNDSDAIDTFSEVKSFLSGFKDTDTLKEGINQEINNNIITEEELETLLT